MRKVGEVIAEAIKLASSEVKMPSHMMYDSKYVRKTPSVEMAELTLYRGALMEWKLRQKEMLDDWRDSMEGPQVLYRKARVLRLPVMKRVVNGASGAIAKGQVFGLSVCRGRTAALANGTQKVSEMVREAAKQRSSSVCRHRGLRSRRCRLC